MAEQDLSRVERNVRRMIELKAPEADIDAYLGTENFTPESFRASVIETAKPDPTGGRVSSDSGFKNTLMQGISLGTADEIASGATAAGRFLKGATYGGESMGDAWKNAGTAYDQQLAAERKSVDDYMKDHPAIGAVTQFAGGMLGGAPKAAAGGVVRGFNYLKNMGEAGAAGAATGFASGEGGAGERAESAAMGGGAGLGMAGIIPFIARGASAVVKLGKNVLGLNDPEAHASRLLIRAFEDDGISFDDAARRLAEWERQGRKPEMLFDLGGENVRSLANTSALVPGPARNEGMTAIAERQGAQGERLSNDIAGSISPNRQFYDTMDELTKTRAEQSRPLYERAFDSGPISSDRVSQFVADPVIQQGIKRGLEIQRLEALANNRPFNPSDYAITGFNDAGDPILGAVPNMRLLDAAKQGIDDILEKYRNPVTGRMELDQKGRAIDAVRRSYIRTLDDLNPDYKAARSAYSGPSQSKSAMALGREIFQKDSELTAKGVENMSPSDREFFKAGVVRALKDISDKARDGTDLTKRIAGTPGMREKLRLAFDSDAEFNAFMSDVKRESDMYASGQFVSPRSGSPTARRLADAADAADDPALDVIGNVLTGNFGQAANSAMGPLRRRASGINTDTSQALSTALFNPRYEDQAQTLARLLKDQTGRTAKDAELRGLARALLQGGGAGLGLQVN